MADSEARPLEQKAVASESGIHDAQDATSKTTSEEGIEEDVVYLTGFKLAILLSSITFCAFLILLDLAIMSPVCRTFTTSTCIEF